MKNIIICISALLMFIACDPQQDDKIELPPAPTSADFTIEPGANPNTYILRNTTQGAFQFIWDLGNGSTATGEVVQAFYPEKGNYEIELTIFTAGGSATSSKILDVADDAPFQCEGNPLYEFLSDCSEKVWRLNPGPGALWVGPSDGSTTWWANGQSDVDARPCAFDDTWTFTGEGKMIYNTNGDIWGEDYMGFNFECVNEADLSDALAPWGSGEHNYTLVAGPPDQLIVTGLGAFLGLPKAANGAEVNTPQTSVTYTILRMEENGANDLLEIEVKIGGNGAWRFTYISE